MPLKSVLWNIPTTGAGKTGGEIQNNAYLTALQNRLGPRLKVMYRRTSTVASMFGGLSAPGMGQGRVLISDSYHRNRNIFINWAVRITGSAKPVSFAWQPYTNPTRNDMKGRLSRWLFWLYYRPCSLIVTNSTGTQKWLSEICGNKNIKILNPSPNLWGKPRTKRLSSVVRLVTVGNIRSIKGFHVLLRALKRLGARPWRLTIFGRVKDEEYYNGLLSYISGNGLDKAVSIITEGGQPDLMNVYSEADVYLQPSLEEGYGMAIAEAMTFGLPVIASDTGGIPDLVKNGINGYLAAPGNEEHLALCISDLIRNPAIIISMGTESQKISRDFTNWRQNADNFIKMLESL